MRERGVRCSLDQNSVRWVSDTIRSTSRSVHTYIKANNTDIKVMHTDLEVNRMVSDTHRTDSGPMGNGHPPLPHSNTRKRRTYSVTYYQTKRSRKKRKKHEGEQPLPPIPTKTRHEMKAYNNTSDTRDDEDEISDSGMSDMTMSPFSDLFSREMSMTESAESTSSRQYSPETVQLRKAARAYTETPDTMSEATTESEGESEISSYYVSSPLPSIDLGQPKRGTLRKYGSVLAAVSLIASLVRLMICGETCALLLTSSIAFLVIMWCPMVKHLVPMWNKERYRMTMEMRPPRPQMRRSNNSCAMMAYAKLNYKG